MSLCKIVTFKLTSHQTALDARFYANILRQRCYSRFKGYAMSKVEILENTTQLLQEQLIQRLSLVPFKKTVEQLDAQWVSKEILSTDTMADAYPDLLIAKSSKPANLRIKGVVSEGTPAIHAKYTSVSSVIYDQKKHQIRVVMLGESPVNALFSQQQ